MVKDVHQRKKHVQHFQVQLLHVVNGLDQMVNVKELIQLLINHVQLEYVLMLKVTII